MVLQDSKRANLQCICSHQAKMYEKHQCPSVAKEAPLLSLRRSLVAVIVFAGGAMQQHNLPRGSCNTVTLHECQTGACGKQNQCHHSDPSIVGCTLENLRSRIFLTRSQAFAKSRTGKGIKITNLRCTLCRRPGVSPNSCEDCDLWHPMIQHHRVW